MITNEKFFLILKEDGIYQKNRRIIAYPSILDKIDEFNWTQNQKFFRGITDTLLFLITAAQDIKQNKFFRYCKQLETFFPQVNLKMEIINLSQEYNFLIMNLGLRIYFCEEPDGIYYGQLNKQNQRHGRGIEFKTTWENQNPQYSITQGEYRDGKKSGKLMVFAGRSKILQFQEQYENDALISKQEYNPDGTIKIDLPKSGGQKRRIVIMDESGVQLNTQPIKQVTHQETKVKYNQQYSQNDEKILSRQGQWLNSSIIDGMIMYFDRENYDNYLKGKCQRILTIDSSHYTNADTDYKLATSLRSLLYEFKGITIFDVYEQVIVVINSNNSHWLSTKVKRNKINDKYEIKFEIMDSMSGDQRKYIKHCEKIFKMLKYHLELGDDYLNFNIEVLNVLQQKDGFSCGDHTCYFIQQIYQRKEEQKAGEVKLIRDFLYEILIK